MSTTMMVSQLLALVLQGQTLRRVVGISPGASRLDVGQGPLPVEPYVELNYEKRGSSEDLEFEIIRGSPLDAGDLW